MDDLKYHFLIFPWFALSYNIFSQQETILVYLRLSLMFSDPFMECLLEAIDHLAIRMKFGNQKYDSYNKKIVVHLIFFVYHLWFYNQ